MVRVLTVDDDAHILLLYEGILEQMELVQVKAATVGEARRLFAEDVFDLVLLDLELPDGNGLEMLPELTEGNDAPEVIIITGTGDTRGAELAFKYGAWDYVKKPFKISEITLPISRALAYRKEKQAQAVPKALQRSGIIGESPQVKRCLDEVGRAAATDAGVLITGETGTGKELFARAIHANSRRSEKPFVVVDCAALPDNLIESTLFGHEKGAFTGADRRQSGLLVQADGGTVMLDEIGDLPLGAQKSFLRALQERCVRPIGGKNEISFNVRLLAATNLDLAAMVEAGTFRQDLYYRIRAMELTLPPLRDRNDDVKEIAVKKLYELSARYGVEVKAVSSEFLEVLGNHGWPGNVRELLNVLEYVLASAGQDPTLYPKHLPPEFRVSELDLPDTKIAEYPVRHVSLRDLDPFPTLNDYRNEHEREYLAELLRRAEGDRKRACAISGVSQSRLYSLIGKHQLNGFGAK